MAKTRPSKKPSKKKAKSALHGTRSGKATKMDDDPVTLFDKATTFLQTGQPDEALSLVERALEISPDGSSNRLIGLSMIGEIYVELGDIDAARENFIKAVALDPQGDIAESKGGGSEKFLWLAQLSEEGGEDSVRWFERGVGVLKRSIQSLESEARTDNNNPLEELKKRLAHALCGVVEIYMTDLSWADDAEEKCDALVTEALMVAPESPECLQTLASVRISQLRQDDARAALSRSLQLWNDLPPESPLVPDFPARISLTRLLMEVEMEHEALEVLERMILEDDHSVETWYLGGWCLYLLGRKDGKSLPESQDPKAAAEHHRSVLLSSRSWLKQSLKLYDIIQYEDEKLKEHALELVHELEQELGEITEDDEDRSEAGNEEDWDDEVEGSDSDDHEMIDS